MPRMSELKCYLQQKKLENTKMDSKNLSLNVNYKPNMYEILFQNMDIIELSKGHRIKHLKTITKSCYKDVVFKLSDNLSAHNFQEHKNHIQEKILVNNLEILSEDGKMIFRIINEKLPTINYVPYKMSHDILPLGVDFENELINVKLPTDPNILIGGVPGCGKSTLLNTIICQIMFNNIGDLYLIDLKAGIEFGMYENCKQVKGYAEEVEDSYSVISAFKREMNRRLKILKEKGIKKYEEYIKEYPGMKRYFLVIDEFTDLMPTRKIKDGEYDVCRELTDLGRKARATGGHLILSTQRPNKDSLPPNLKAVCSCPVGFRTSNSVNSKIIIDEGGLEELENRKFVCICSGRKTQGRTMFLSDETLKEMVQKNTSVAKHEKIEHELKKEPAWI